MSAGVWGGNDTSGRRDNQSVRVAGKGRADTKPCAGALRSHGKAGASIQEESHAGPPSHKCLMERFPPTPLSLTWMHRSASAGYPVAGMWAL